MLQDMQSGSKLINTPYRSLESSYLVERDTGDAITSSDDILGTFCHETDIDFNVLVGTTIIVRNKTADSPSDLSQNNPIQLVDIKGYFMKKISRT